MHAAAPVALLVHEVLVALFPVVGLVLGDEVLVADLVDLVEGVQLAPLQPGFAAEVGIEGPHHALEVRLEGLEHRVEFGALDAGDPADDAVELLVLLLARHEAQEVEGDIEILGGFGDREGEADVRLLEERAFDEGAVDRIVRIGQGEIHDADGELAVGLLLQAAGVPRAGRHEDGVLLHEQEHGLVAGQAAEAGLELVGQFAQHLEARLVRREVQVHEAGAVGHVGLVAAEGPVAVEIRLADGGIRQEVEHGEIPHAHVVLRAGDGGVGLAVGGRVPADFLAGGDEFAIGLGGLVAAGELFQQVLVVEDAHPELGEGNRHVLLHLVDEGPAHAVLDGIAQELAREFGAGVVGVRLVGVAGHREAVTVVVLQPQVPRQDAEADFEQVGGGAAHELRGGPLREHHLGDSLLHDVDVRVQLAVVLRHDLQGVAHAGFELPVADTQDDGARGRLLGAVGGDPGDGQGIDDADGQQRQVLVQEADHGASLASRLCSSRSMRARACLAPNFR